jgi:hypothetical protein
MGEMDSLFEIELDLAAKGSRDSSRSLYRQLKAAILDGRLPAGAKLPATRHSETFYGVSRNTAVEVYEGGCGHSGNESGSSRTAQGVNLHALTAPGPCSARLPLVVLLFLHKAKS